jgi:TatD DNase family protein
VVNIIDTHCHLYAEEFNDDRELAIERALAMGVSKILLPNIDLESIEGLHALTDTYQQVCFPMMGLHPCYVKEDYQSVLKVIFDWFEKRKYFAVGEIGMDLYWDKTTKSWQEDAFIQQVEFAISKNLPLAIHSRNATHELIQLLKPYKGKVTGVFHCFSESAELANEIIKLDFLLGLGGVLTFKNAGLPHALEKIDLKHIILETDSPYLAPVPYRGKRNEPSYTRLIADKLAEVKGISAAEIYEITTANAERLFFAL